jgi:hypothetical protein
VVRTTLKRWDAPPGAFSTVPSYSRQDIGFEITALLDQGVDRRDVDHGLDIALGGIKEGPRRGGIWPTRSSGWIGGRRHERMTDVYWRKIREQGRLGITRPKGRGSLRR